MEGNNWNESRWEQDWSTEEPFYRGGNRDPKVLKRNRDHDLGLLQDEWASGQTAEAAEQELPEDTSEQHPAKC